jgi:oligopeptide/dipeptide ABC transporter ATP-binding protein
MAPKRELFADPKHPYTETLLAAVLQPDPKVRTEPRALAANGHLDAVPAGGCAFAPRCPYAVERCRRERPVLEPVAPGHLARCHRVGEIRLAPLPRRTRPVAHA